MQRTVYLALVLVAAVTASAFGQTQNNGELAREVAALRAEVAQLRANQEGNWMTERRAEQVKALIQDVLTDAETCASLLDNDMTAGWNKHFFLASADGKFLLELAGQVQVRWLLSHVDNDSSGTDDTHSGFQMRRVKVKFSGHIGDPKFKYKITLASGRDNDTDGGDAYAEEAWVSYGFENGITLQAGRFKAPFLREELTSSSEQLTVERSYVNEQFTTGYTEGIAICYGTEMWKVCAMVSDGSEQGEYNSSSSDFNNVDSDFAFTGRLDVKLMGDWKQMKDFTTWSEDDTAIFLGAAVHWEDDEDTGIATDDQNDFFVWTIDASAECHGFALYTAVIGWHENYDSGGASTDGDVYAWIIQGSYNINDQIEPFVRYEKLCGDPDSNRSELTEMQDFITFGFNYYIRKHAAKFTADAIYALQTVEKAEDGLGLYPAYSNDDDNLWAFRLQFQLLF